MSAVALLTVALIAGFAFGAFLGRTWGALPLLRPGQVVKFAGGDVGRTYSLAVQEITYDQRTTTVVLTSKEAPR